MRFFCSPRDDYRRGPYLVTQIAEPSADDEFWYTVHLPLPPTDKFHVYYAPFAYEEAVSAQQMRTFDSVASAIDYCRQQFVLTNDGECPFVGNGEFTGAYHPCGDRPAVVLPAGAALECTRHNDQVWGEGYEYLLVVGSRDIVMALSLNETSVWPK